jgi:carbonic anhydrase
MCEHHGQSASAGSSRRQFVKLAAGAGLTALATGIGRRANAQPAGEPVMPMADLTPDKVLDLLAEGNRRFAAGNVTAPHRSLARLKEVAAKQTPIAAFLGCADSRVPIEIVFDQGFGDLFVTRVAGNIVDAEIIGSLEFGTAVLGAKVLYVLGHSSCGAVAAAVKGEEVPGQISSLFEHLRPAVRSAQGDAVVAVLENVRYQAMLLGESSPVIARLVREGRLRVAGGVYDLTTGRVTPVDL